MKTLLKEAVIFFGFVIFGALCFLPLFAMHLIHL